MSTQVIKKKEDKVEYLSSSFNESDYKFQSKPDENQELQINSKFFLEIMLNFIVLLTLMFPLVALVMFIFIIQCIIKAIKNVDRCDNLQKIPVLIWFILICLATIDTQVAYFMYLGSEKIFIYLFSDAITFFQSLLLVISYVNISHAHRSPSYAVNSVDKYIGNKVLNTLVYQEKPIFPGKTIDFDVYHQNSDHIIQSYEKTMKSISVQPGICFYTEFQLGFIATKKEYKDGYTLVQDFFEKIEINYYQFVMLLFVFSIKLLLSFCYIFTQEQKSNSFEVSDTIQVFITIGIYFYTLWNLHRVLGNYDLRRKKMQMDKLNEKIDFSKTMTEGYKSKLDITCPISLESWDNSRKYICEVEQSFLKHLEFAYICFFFNYIFVTLIVVSAFGEFYWIFPKDSRYLEPLPVLINTMNFIFLNTFLSFRLWEGQKYNDTFRDLECSVDRLIDVNEDLITMYDEFFNAKSAYLQDKETNQTEAIRSIISELEIKTNFNRFSVYSLVVKKIKQRSYHYINNSVVYCGQIYNLNQKTQLREKILNNMLQSLQRIKRSIKNDSETKRYKFLNVFSVSFAETISTVLIAIITVLPVVIPKLIQLYFK